MFSSLWKIQCTDRAASFLSGGLFLAPLFLLNYFLFNLFFILAKKCRAEAPSAPSLARPLSQDEISRIGNRKRGRNMWNRCGNTTVNTRLLVFPLLRSQRNRTTFLHVSVRFQLKETNVSASVTFYISIDVIRPKCSRKYKDTFRKHVFLLFPLT